MPAPQVIMPRWLSTLLKIWFIQELWANLKLFGPIALGYVLSILLNITSLVFCGHYPKDTALVLEGAGLGFSILNLTDYLVMFGMGSALDTLAAQAYGAQSYKKVGVYLQRGILIHALALLMVLGLWANLESILNLLHQPPCVVRYTVSFIHGYTFALPAILFYYLLQKYLQAQGIVYPFVISQTLGILASVLAHYLLMFVADLGILGAGIACGIAECSGLATLLAIIWIRKLHKLTWDGWSWECLNDWGQYIAYGIPGFFIMIAEIGIYEVGIFVVGLIGSLQQSILVVLFNYHYILLVVTYALRMTAGVRVGNELGAGSPKKAKRAMFVGLCVAVTWLVPIEVVTLTLKDYIPMIFTSDPTILQAINVHFYVMVVSIFCDALQSTLSGVIIGSGWQIAGAVLNILCFWVVGIPIAVSLAIAVHLGALGYMAGAASAVFCVLCSYSVTVASMNWTKRSEVAQKMAVMQQGEVTKQAAGLSFSKGTETPKEKSSSEVIPKEGNEGTNATNPEQDTSKKPDSSSMHDTPSNAASEPKDASSKESKKKFPVSWRMVILRILTVAPFIILCVGAVVISQELVYHQTPCNLTIAGNESECLPLGEVRQNMSASVPPCTNYTGVMSTINHLPSPTPAPQQG